MRCGRCTCWLAISVRWDIMSHGVFCWLIVCVDRCVLFCQCKGAEQVDVVQVVLCCWLCAVGMG